MIRNPLKIAGVIAEFNPFHDGHAYLLKQAREVTGADFVVVVMSGSFVQRGTPAVMEKSLRVRAALSHGADAVFELPVRAATGSADYFAEGAVWLLSALGVTDLCFGCETDDLSALEQLADVLAEEPAPFRAALKNGLKNGLSYAAAVQLAMEEYLKYASKISFEDGFQKSQPPKKNQDSQQYSPGSLKGSETDFTMETSAFSEREYADFSSMLSLPNNLLAISYLKALRKQNSAIRPHAIKRLGAAYHSEDSAPVSETLPSAAALRKLMREAADRAATDADAFCALRPYLSESLCSLYQPDFGQAFPIFSDDFSLLLGKTLLDLKPDDAYFDCAPDLYRRICNNRRNFTSFDTFCQKIHTKQFPLASAQRGVLHCMLDLKARSKEDIYAAYLPLLGFRRGSEACLAEISQRSLLPLLSKTCEGKNLSDPRAVRQWEEIMHADALYRLARCCRFGKEFPLPEQAQIIVVI